MYLQLTQPLSNQHVLVAADGTYSFKRVELLVRSEKVRVVIFRIGHLSSLLSEYKSLLDLVKQESRTR